jgi:hypothetical protein
MRDSSFHAEVTQKLCGKKMLFCAGGVTYMLVRASLPSFICASCHSALLMVNTAH